MQKTLFFKFFLLAIIGSFHHPTTTLNAINISDMKGHIKYNNFYNGIRNNFTIELYLTPRLMSFFIFHNRWGFFENNRTGQIMFLQNHFDSFNSNFSNDLHSNIITSMTIRSDQIEMILQNFNTSVNQHGFYVNIYYQNVNNVYHSQVWIDLWNNNFPLQIEC